jgi:hypothetical protein
MVIHVYHPYRQPDAPNHCLPLNGRCSHICMPAPQLTVNSAKTSCACPRGLKLDKDNLNCIHDRELNLLLVLHSLVFILFLVSFCSADYVGVSHTTPQPSFIYENDKAANIIETLIDSGSTVSLLAAKNDSVDLSFKNGTDSVFAAKNDTVDLSLNGTEGFVYL